MADPKPSAAPMTGDDLRAFSTAVLHGIGAPATPWNLDWLKEWAASEGTLAANNPLATERPQPGHDSRFNSNGVRNYDSFDVGVQATVETLGLSYYQSIVDSMRAQKFTNRPAILRAYQTWAGVSAPEAYHVARLIKGGWQPNGAKTLQAAEVAVPTRSAPVLAEHARKGAHDAAVVGGAGLVAAAVASIAGDFPWEEAQTMWQAHHWYALIALATPFAVHLISAFTGRSDG